MPMFKGFIFVVALTACFAWGAASSAWLGWKAPQIKWLNKPQKEALYAVKEHKPFVIIVPSFNNSEWVERNLNSIFTQKYDHYRVIYIDDASTDSTLQGVNACIALHDMGHRIDILHNEVNKGACENIYRAIRSCADEEIALTLDGDDWFAHDRGF